MDDKIKETIALVRELDLEATPKPWEVEVSEDASIDMPRNYGVMHDDGDCLLQSGPCGGPSCEDAYAIAHYRTAAPALADECERLHQTIEENVPLPWCPQCKSECELVDDRLCCLICETDVVSPTSEHVARVAELERRLSQYECPEHPEPKFGECDECDKHDQSWEDTPL